MKCGNEVIIKTIVTALLDALTPIDAFYMSDLNQRSIDEERVAQLIKSQNEAYSNSSEYPITMTIITLGCCPQLVTPINHCGLVVVDGQHRMACLRHINQFTPLNLFNHEIMVKVYHSEHRSDLREYFININRNHVPVSDYNLDNQLKMVIDAVINWFIKTYDPCFFRTSDHSNRPFMTIKNLREHLALSALLKDVVCRSDLNTDQKVKETCQHFLEYNKMLTHKNPEFFAEGPTDTKVYLTSYKKCFNSPKPLYVGLIRHYTWIDDALKTPLALAPAPAPAKVIPLKFKPRLALAP
jgi:hypothetical protein